MMKILYANNEILDEVHERNIKIIHNDFRDKKIINYLN